MASSSKRGVVYSLAKVGKGIRWISFLPRPPNALRTAKPRHLKEIETARWALLDGPQGTDIILMSFAHPRSKLPYECSIHAYVFCNGDGSPIPKKLIKKTLKSKHGIRAELILLESHTLMATVRRELSIVALLRHTGASKKRSCSFMRIVFQGNDKDGYAPKPTVRALPTPIIDTHASLCPKGHPFHFIKSSFVGMFPDLGTRVNKSKMFVASDITGMFIVTKMTYGDIVYQFGLWWVSTETKCSTLIAVHDTRGTYMPDETPVVDGVPDVFGTAENVVPYSNAALRNIVEALQSQTSLRMRVIGYTTKDGDGLPSCGTIIVTALQRGLSVTVSDTMAFEIVRCYRSRQGGEPLGLYTLGAASEPTTGLELQARSPALYYAGVFQQTAWTLRVGVGHGRRLVDNQLQDIVLYERLPSNPMAQVKVFEWACRFANIVLLEGYSMPQSRLVYLMAHCASARGELLSILVVIDVVLGYAFALNVYGQEVPHGVIATFENPTIDIFNVKYSRGCVLPDMTNDEVLAATWVPSCDYRRCTLSETSDQRRAAAVARRVRAIHGRELMTRSDSVAISRDSLPNPQDFMDDDDPELLTRSISDLRQKKEMAEAGPQSPDSDDSQETDSTGSSSSDGSGTVSSASTSRPSSPHRIKGLVNFLPALPEGESSVRARRRHNSMSAALSSLQNARNSEWESHVIASQQDYPVGRRKSQDSPLSFGAKGRTTRRAKGPRLVHLPLTDIPTKVPEVMRPVAIFTRASVTGQIDNVDSLGRPEHIIVVCPLVIIIINPVFDPDKNSHATTILVADVFGEGASIMSAKPYQDMTTPCREMGMIRVTLALMSDSPKDTHATGVVFV